MEKHWHQGAEDATLTVRAAPCSAPRLPDAGVRVFDVVHELLVVSSHAARQSKQVKQPAAADGGSEDAKTGVDASKAVIE